MPKTWYLRNTTTNGTAPPGANEFTGNSTATWDLLAATAASATLATSQPTTGATEIGYAHTGASDPGGAGVNGMWTVEVNVTTAFSTSQIAVQIHRVNSSGVIQASSPVTAEQAGSATGVKTFTVDCRDLGQWNATDRIRVDYRFRNTSTMTAGGPTITVNTVDAEVVMPDAPVVMMPFIPLDYY